MGGSVHPSHGIRAGSHSAVIEPAYLLTCMVQGSGVRQTSWARHWHNGGVCPKSPYVRHKHVWSGAMELCALNLPTCGTSAFGVAPWSWVP